MSRMSILFLFLIGCQAPYFSYLVLLDDYTKNLIFSCYEAKNQDALLIMGTYKYFLNQEIIEGKKLIEEVVSCGDSIATWSHFTF